MNAMDVPVSVVRSTIPEAQGAPLTRWPLFLYAESKPGLVGKPSQTQERVDAYIKQALKVTKEVADALGMEELKRAPVDWTYALHMVEEKGLLRKPIETYTIDDIKLIASWLTRLTAKNPGNFRNFSVKWPLKTWSQEDKEKLDHIALLHVQPDSEFSEEETAFFQDFYLYFIAPEDIEPNLCLFLDDLKKFVGYVKEPVERTQKVLDLSCLIFQNVVTIHAFEEGNKRLGRMLMYIFLAQHGLEPITFYSAKIHDDNLIASLARKANDSFKMYVRESYIISTKMRKNPLYLEIVRDVFARNLQTGLFPELLHMALLDHPLQKAFEAQEVALKKQIPEGKICAQCRKSPESAPDRKLLQCAACSAEFYCSASCQKAHWPTHKPTCKKGVQKK